MAKTEVILTDYGNEQILKAIANDTNVLVQSIVYGDGGGYPVTLSSAQTSLVRQVGEITNVTKRYDEKDGFIYFAGTIPANAPGFTMRELGIVDIYGNLLAVAAVPDTSKPDEEDGLEVTLPISIGFKTSAGEVMIVYVDKGDEYPDKTWVIQQIANIDHISGRNW